MANKGQSMIEVVVAIGVMALTLVGVVALMAASAGIQNNQQRRQSATKLAEKVSEGLVNLRDTNPTAFWALTPAVAATDSDYLGYTYSVSYVPDNTCNNLPVVKCVNVTITVSWTGSKGTESFTLLRFFNR